MHSFRYSLRILFAKKKTDTTLSAGSPMWDGGTLSLVILLPMLLVVLAVGICMCASHRYGKMLRQESRCQYIEVRKLHCD